MTAPADDARDDSLHVLIFAKTPRLGRCKTRLARRVGAMRALRCHRAMTEHVVSRVGTLALGGPVTLCCAPDTRHPFLRRLARDYGCRLAPQARGDLGQRMHHALAAALTTHRRAVILGTDQPERITEPLAEVDAWLGATVPACMAPTVDGGYWLIGLSRAESRVFQGIDWSTPHVARQTRGAFRRADLDWHEPARRRDIDTYRDWRALSPATRSSLSRAAVGRHMVRPRPAPDRTAPSERARLSRCRRDDA